MDSCPHFEMEPEPNCKKFDLTMPEESLDHNDCGWHWPNYCGLKKVELEEEGK